MSNRVWDRRFAAYRSKSERARHREAHARSRRLEIGPLPQASVLTVAETSSANGSAERPGSTGSDGARSGLGTSLFSECAAILAELAFRWVRK